MKRVDSMKNPSETRTGDEKRGSPLEVLAVFTRLGLTSFGGPVAHLGYFHDEFVKRRKWMDDQSYADLVALCQFLPGPASSQVAIAIGIARAGLTGGFAAWVGFTLPSAIAMIAFAFGVAAIGDVSGAGWLRGLKIVAVAVVAHALWGMAAALTPDRVRVTIAIFAAVTTLLWQTSLGQISVIAAGGFFGWWLLSGAPLIPERHTRYRIGRSLGAISLVLFFGLLAGLPLLRDFSNSFSLSVFDSFYRAGSLVFGGGHVVLPLLQAEVVPPGWLTNEAFIAGYGAAQAVPGPLFTFSAYLGAVMNQGSRLGTALIALIAVFLPSFLLVIGALPFWDKLRSFHPFQAALRGVNAAVVGILLAALYHPVWTSAILSSIDFAIAIAAFLVLAFWKWPPWLVVLLTAFTAWGAAIFI
jgi:chromate transporter